MTTKMLLRVFRKYPLRRNYTKRVVYVSEINDPATNCCIEKYLAETVEADNGILLLWRNDKSVFIGRNQNPFRECNLKNMAEDDVTLIRRQSGGGAVYHDLGNTNFSFMSKLYTTESNYETIIKALDRLNIEARVSGRNDIVIGNKKISGSAYSNNGKIFIHHGTMLVDLNMELISKYLTPNKKKLESKSVDSVQSRVTNLKNYNVDITHNNLMDAIINEIATKEDVQIRTLNDSTMKEWMISNSIFSEWYKKYTDWNWNYGNTNAFDFNVEKYFKWGMINVSIKCENGMIADINIESDSLYPEMIDILMKNYKSQQFTSVGLIKAHELSIIDAAKSNVYVNAMEEFSEWLSSTL